MASTQEFSISFTDRHVVLRCNGAVVKSDGKTQWPYRSAQEGAAQALAIARGRLNVENNLQLGERAKRGDDSWQLNGERREVQVALLYICVVCELDWVFAKTMLGEVNDSISVYTTLGGHSVLQALNAAEARVEEFRRVAVQGEPYLGSQEHRYRRAAAPLRRKETGGFEPPRFVVVGATGAGKSTLLNAILGRDLLFAGSDVSTGAVIEVKRVVSPAHERLVVRRLDDKTLAHREQETEAYAAASLAKLEQLQNDGVVPNDLRDEVAAMVQGEPRFRRLIRPRGFLKQVLHGQAETRREVERALTDLRAAFVLLLQYDSAKTLALNSEHPLNNLTAQDQRLLLNKYVDQGAQHGYCAGVARVVVELDCDVLQHLTLVDAPGLFDPTGGGQSDFRRAMALREIGGAVAERTRPCDAWLYLSKAADRSHQVGDGWDACYATAQSDGLPLSNGIWALSRADAEVERLKATREARASQFPWVLRESALDILPWVMVPYGVVEGDLEGALQSVVGIALPDPRARRTLLKLDWQALALEAILGDFVKDATGIPFLVSALSKVATKFRDGWAEASAGELIAWANEVAKSLDEQRDSAQKLRDLRHDIKGLEAEAKRLDDIVSSRQATKASCDADAVAIHTCEPSGTSLPGARGDFEVEARAVLILHFDGTLDAAASWSLSGQRELDLSNVLQAANPTLVRAAQYDWASWKQNITGLVCATLTAEVDSVHLDTAGCEPNMRNFVVRDAEGFWESWNETKKRMRRTADQHLAQYAAEYSESLKIQLSQAWSRVCKKGDDAVAEAENRLESALADKSRCADRLDDARRDAPENEDAYQDRLSRIEALLVEVHDFILRSARWAPGG